MKLSLKKNTLIPVFTGLVAIVWLLHGGLRYGYWDPIRGPLPGLVPSIMAAALLFVSIIGIIHSLKEKVEPDRLENWTILIAAFGTFALVFLVGMIAALLVFVFVWMRLYEKESWKNTIIILIISFGISYGVFAFWLQVPFPRGLIMNTIMNLILH